MYLTNSLDSFSQKSKITTLHFSLLHQKNLMPFIVGHLQPGQSLDSISFLLIMYSFMVQLELVFYVHLLHTHHLQSQGPIPKHQP